MTLLEKIMMHLYRLAIVGLLILSSGYAASYPIGYVPTNVTFQRVYAVRIGNLQGSAFTIDVDNKQYLVTARHLFRDNSTSQNISIFFDTAWANIQVKLVVPLVDSFDVAVLAPPFQLSPTADLITTIDKIVIGQEMFFLGFPSMLRSIDKGLVNRGYPLAFVKKAVLSAIGLGRFGNKMLYLDGHNNPGFSGGPVVFWNQGYNKQCIAGVISGFRGERLLKPDNTRTLVPTDSLFGNSGIILATPIDVALDMITRNPIGAKIAK